MKRQFSLKNNPSSPLSSTPKPKGFLCSFLHQPSGDDLTVSDAIVVDDGVDREMEKVDVDLVEKIKRVEDEHRIVVTLTKLQDIKKTMVQATIKKSLEETP
uniref:Uncharacterized protein n=1 Tax=Solanum tuberosum TaxID=4113 RepID=M1DDZ0_SOLTU